MIRKMAASMLTMCNGKQVPMVGFGTYFGTPDDYKEDTVVSCIESAIDVGYRSIDTALLYRTEPLVARAVKNKIADGTIKREDIFITSKIPFDGHEPKDVEASVKQSLKNLQMDYIDLYLIHTPFSAVKPEDGAAPDPSSKEEVKLSTTNDHVKTWKALEQFVKNGQIKSIGVSNFNSEQIQRILDNCEIKPSMNQVEVQPYFSNDRLVKFCQERGVTITAYTPLGQPHSSWAPAGWVSPLQNPAITALATKYNKSPAQIAMKLQLARNIVIVVKASSAKRQTENIDLFDFELSPEDLKSLLALDKNQRMNTFPAFMKHKDYPFNIPF